MRLKSLLVMVVTRFKWKKILNAGLYEQVQEAGVTDAGCHQLSSARVQGPSKVPTKAAVLQSAESEVLPPCVPVDSFEHAAKAFSPKYSV